jgi:hypothetical protein
MVDLLIKIACFVKNESGICIIKSNRSKLASARRSSILSHPFVNYVQVFKVESYVDLFIMTMKSIFY